MQYNCSKPLSIKLFGEDPFEVFSGNLFWNKTKALYCCISIPRRYFYIYTERILYIYTERIFLYLYREDTFISISRGYFISTVYREYIFYSITKRYFLRSFVPMNMSQLKIELTVLFSTTYTGKYGPHSR